MKIEHITPEEFEKIITAHYEKVMVDMSLEDFKYYSKKNMDGEQVDHQEDYILKGLLEIVSKEDSCAEKESFIYRELQRNIDHERLSKKE